MLTEGWRRSLHGRWRASGESCPYRRRHKEERVVGPRRALRDGQRGGARKLVAVADDEGVEGVAGLSWAAEDQSKRPCSGARWLGAAAGLWAHALKAAQAAVLALRRDRGIFLRSHETHIVELQRLQIYRFLIRSPYLSPMCWNSGEGTRT